MREEWRKWSDDGRRMLSICYMFCFFFFLNGWLVDWLNFILKLKCRHGGNLVTWPILSMDNESSKIHIIFSYYFLNRSIGIVKSKRSLTKAIYRKNHENRWTSPLIGQSYKYQFSCLIFANILLLPIFYCSKIVFLQNFTFDEKPEESKSLSKM